MLEKLVRSLRQSDLMLFDFDLTVILKDVEVQQNI